MEEEHAHVAEDHCSDLQLHEHVPLGLHFLEMTICTLS